MLKFVLMLPIRILCMPIIIAMKLIFWVCTGLLYMSEWIFGVVSSVLFLFGLVGIFMVSLAQGLIIIGLAFLVSPFGMPMLAVKLVCLVEIVCERICSVVY